MDKTKEQKLRQAVFGTVKKHYQGYYYSKSEWHKVDKISHDGRVFDQNEITAFKYV